MLVLGLTGGIGAGKTEVARIFETLGAKVLNADLIAKAISDTDPTVIQQIKAHFGEQIYSPAGLLRRKELGQIVFSEPEKLKILNEIVHPPTISKLRSEIQLVKKLNRYPLLVIESALIFEIGLETEFDRVVVVSADPARIVERLQERDQLSQQAIESRIKSQLDPASKEELADIVIQNNSDIENLTKTVTRIFKEVIKMNSVNISEKLQL